MFEEASMRLMVVVLAMVLAGVAVAQEKELPDFAAMIPGMSGAVVVADYMDPAPDPQFGKPKAGNKLIAVQLMLVSGDAAGADGRVSNPVKVNPMYAEIKCSDAAIRKSAMGSAPDPALTSAAITEPSDRVMGWVAFEIPAALRAAECKLNYGIMTDKTRWISLAAAASKQPPPAEAPK